MLAEAALSFLGAPADDDDPDQPLKTPVTDDHFLYLGPAGGMRLPNFMMPPLMNNHGNYIASLGNVCRWLAGRAEALGVEIYPGFAAAELIFDDNGAVKGVATGDMGIGRDGEPTAMFARGMELHGKYVLIGEGVRGSLAKQLIEKYDLSAGHEPQKFGIGMKEIWEIDPAKHKEGTVVHTMGWPLGKNAGGGSFIYHAENNQVFIGFVVHLNYANPYLYPYAEFQRFKHHPMVAELLEGVEVVVWSAGAGGGSAGNFASVVRNRPPDTMLTVIDSGPRSADSVRVSASSAALAAV